VENLQTEALGVLLIGDGGCAGVAGGQFGGASGGTRNARRSRIDRFRE